MCRGTVEGARRCPCDTSAARQARRQRVRLSGTHKDKLSKPFQKIESTPAPVEDSTEERMKQLVQQVQADSDLLSELSQKTGVYHGPHRNWFPDEIIEHYKQLDELTIKVGVAVEEIAVIKYNAPTDEYIHEQIESLREQHLDEKKTINEEVSTSTEAYLKSNEELYATAREVYDEANGEGSFANLSFREREKIMPIFCPEMSERTGKLKSRYEELTKLRHETWKRHEEENTTARHALLKKRNEANKAALEEAGVTFADPSTLATEESSSKTAQKALQSALPYVPQSWVNASNERTEKLGTGLLIKSTAGRAHYKDRTFLEVTGTQTSVNGMKMVDIEVDPNVDNPHPHLSYLPFPEKGHWIDPNDKSSLFARPNITPEGQTPWVRVEMEVKEDKSQVKGKGWEEYTYNKEEHTVNPTTGESEFVSVPTTVWRRTKTKRTKHITGFTSELTVPNNQPGTNPMSEVKGSSVALHEFGHRSQASDQRIQNMEHAFLYRRSGRHDGDGEDLSLIYEKQRGKEAEMGIKDSFSTHYIGKYYNDGYTEVTSMGLQALWAGDQGAFAGLNDAKADRDMKHFMLGMIAATGKEKYERF